MPCYDRISTAMTNAINDISVWCMLCAARQITLLTTSLLHIPAATFTHSLPHMWWTKRIVNCSSTLKPSAPSRLVLSISSCHALPTASVRRDAVPQPPLKPLLSAGLADESFWRGCDVGVTSQIGTERRPWGTTSDRLMPRRGLYDETLMLDSANSYVFDSSIRFLPRCFNIIHQ